MKENKTVLKLKSVKFVNFGARACPPRQYLSIDLFGNRTSTDKINRWLKANDIGEDIICLSHRQLYDGEFMLKYYLGLSRHTKIVDSSGKKLPKKKLAKGCSIDIIARIYPSTHWRGLGVKRLVEKIIVHDDNTK